MYPLHEIPDLWASELWDLHQQEFVCLNTKHCFPGNSHLNFVEFHEQWVRWQTSETRHYISEAKNAEVHIVIIKFKFKFKLKSQIQIPRSALPSLYCNFTSLDRKTTHVLTQALVISHLDYMWILSLNLNTKTSTSTELCSSATVVRGRK